MQDEVLDRLRAMRRGKIRSGEQVELPDGRACSPAEAQALGYDVIATGEAERPYRLELRAPPLMPVTPDHKREPEGKAARGVTHGRPTPFPLAHRTDAARFRTRRPRPAGRRCSCALHKRSRR